MTPANPDRSAPNEACGVRGRGRFSRVESEGAHEAGVLCPHVSSLQGHWQLGLVFTLSPAEGTHVAAEVKVDCRTKKDESKIVTNFFFFLYYTRHSLTVKGSSLGRWLPATRPRRS